MHPLTALAIALTAAAAYAAMNLACFLIVVRALDAVRPF